MGAIKAIKKKGELFFGEGLTKESPDEFLDLQSLSDSNLWINLE